MPANLAYLLWPQQWPQDWKRSVFIPIPKKGNAKECSNYRSIVLISQASKGMLKSLQARLKQCVNRELPDVQAGFRKGRGTRDQIANICWIIEKAGEFQKNIYFCLTDYAKAFDCVVHHKLWKILQEMGVPDHLTCLLRNLYAGQEPIVRTGHGTTDWFQIRKGVHQGCILPPCLFNLYAHAKSWLIGKDSDAGRDWGQEEKGMTEDERAGWHHWLDGCESEWTPGVGDGQGGLACCDSWGHKESDTTEQLNWVHHEKHWTGWSTSWNQDCWEKY